MEKWPETLTEARRMQESLSLRVTLSPLRSDVTRVAAVDASYRRGMTAAAAVVYDLATMTCVEESCHVAATTFPYIPGYLSFREGPALLAAIGKLHGRPDVILVDGQGIAHPRGLGMASFLGVLLEIPTIGCAKSRLVGEYRDPPPGRGGWSELLLEGKTVGAVLRTRDRVRPLFVSPGHLVTLADAVALVLRCCTRYRIPEPQRHADALSKVLKKRFGQ